MSALHLAPTHPDADASRRLELLARYDGRAPRYTSYPTALQFTGEVDAELYGQWLASLDPAESISLYAHIPFCHRLCWYCGCNTRAVRKPELISAYVDNLVQELILIEAKLPGRLAVGAVHLGGGTPNILSRDDLVSLFGALKQVFRFKPGIEIAAELDPSVLTESWARAAAFHGLNRASLGVQDLSPHVQEAVNRHESFEVVERAVGWLREAGIASINLDLMYGLPRQTQADVIRTLDQILTLRPERVALFGYAHVPWAKPHQRLINAAELAGAAERLDQSEAAAQHLIAAGYVRVGLDHFALPTDSMAIGLGEGALRRNFQGYTTDGHATLLGLGASSIGRMPGGFVQNITNEVAWRDAVLEGRLPVARGVVLTDDDRFRGDLIEQLMCDLQVDLAATCARHGLTLDALAEDIQRLCALEADGVVRLVDHRLSLTDLGRPFVRMVAQVFDRRSGDPNTHSRIV